LLLAIWIVLPPPSHRLVPLAVGAPELCGWLGALALAAAALTATGTRRTFVRRGGLLCAMAALALAALPLARFGSVADAAAAARRAVAGDADVASLDVRELFVGVAPGTATVTRGIRVGAPGGVALTVDVYQPIPAAGPRP